MKLGFITGTLIGVALIGFVSFYMIATTGSGKSQPKPTPYPTLPSMCFEEGTDENGQPYERWYEGEICDSWDWPLSPR